MVKVGMPEVPGHLLGSTVLAACLGGCPPEAA